MKMSIYWAAAERRNIVGEKQLLREERHSFTAESWTQNLGNGPQI